MRPDRFRLPLAPCFLLALLPLAVACTREPAESSSPATAPPASAIPAAPAASTAPVAPAAGQPAPPLGSEPTAVPRSTAIASGHIVLTGDYQADSDAEVTCATADTALQLTFFVPGKPRVLILLEGLATKGTSGTYKGQVTIAAADAGEAALRQSGGKASSEVTVDDVTTGKVGKAVSGSFATTYTGEAGKGKVTGRFERCIFKPEPDAAP
jgi:hypothetical protein